MEPASEQASPHTIVWIDSSQARLFVLGGLGKQVKTVIPSEHRGRTPGRMAVRHGGDNNRYLDAILAALPPEGGILLIGPDDTKTELAAYLKQKSADIAGRIRGVETSTATADGQLLAKARAFFLARPGPGGA